MTEFAKFINIDTIRRPPRHLRTPQIIAFNFDKNETLLRQEGYLPLQYDEAEEPQEGFFNKPTYEDCGDHIQVHYVEEEIQEGEGE